MRTWPRYRKCYHPPGRMPACALLACMFVALALLVGSATAHEGHDHGPSAPLPPTTVTPRLAAHSDTYDLVAIASGAAVTIYLERYASNEPVTNARISVMAGADSYDVAPRPDGTYGVAVPAFARPGRHELIFTIAHPDGDDLLAGAIDVGSGGATAAAPPATWWQRFARQRHWPLVLGLVAGVLAGVLASRLLTSGRTLLIAAGVALAVVVLAAAPSRQTLQSAKCQRAGAHTADLHRL